VLWLLEELGLAYEIKRYQRDPKTMLAPAELRQVHPLGKTPWFAGAEFTAADVQMSFPLEAAVVRGGLDSRWPNLLAFLGRIHARPAYQRAIERGGEYQLLR